MAVWADLSCRKKVRHTQRGRKFYYYFSFYSPQLQCKKRREERWNFPFFPLTLRSSSERTKIFEYFSSFPKSWKLFEVTKKYLNFFVSKKINFYLFNFFIFFSFSVPTLRQNCGRTKWSSLSLCELI